MDIGSLQICIFETLCFLCRLFALKFSFHPLSCSCNVMIWSTSNDTDFYSTFLICVPFKFLGSHSHIVRDVFYLRPGLY